MAYSDQEQALRVASAISAVTTGCCLRYGLFASIQRQPRVALNFNTDADGGNVGVLIGQASVAASPIAPNRLKAYLRKYRQGIQDIGMTPASLQADYSLAILVTPLTLRGM